MRSIKRAVTALCLAVVALFPLAAGADEAPSLGVVEAIGIATEAYIYGYPLVTFDMVRRQQTNVAAPDAEHAPMGQMIKMRTYPAVDNHCCAAPNADTLYTEVWLDVSKEPWIFSIPDMGDRYYIMPMLDGWSEVIEVASSRTTGGKAQTYAITGPGWSGTLPQGVTQVKSPTGMVWILGRIYSTGTPEDYQAVHALQDKFSVVPLSAYGKPYTPPPGVVDPELRHEDGGAQAGQRPGHRCLFQPPRETDEDQSADGAGCADRRADGQDRTGPGAGLRPGQARVPRPGGDQDRSQAGAPGDGTAPEEAEDDQRVAVLHQGRRQLRHRLSAAGHGQPPRSRLEPSAGRRVSALAEGRERRRVQRRQAQVRDALREGPDAAGRSLLVAHDVRHAISSSCRIRSTATT